MKKTLVKKTLATMTGLALGGSMALAQEQGTTQDYDPNRDIVTETERESGTGMETQREDSPIQSEYGTEPQTQTESDMSTDPYGTDESRTDTTTEAYSSKTETHKDMSEMSADHLNGKSVVTATGEEIGEIDEVGYSSTHQERVAVIEAGGFLGVGEKRIAIPLSELQIGTDDNVKTTMTRDSIEMQEEFDEAGFTADQEGDTGDPEQ